MGLHGCYCTEKTGKSNFWQGTKTGLATGKCGAGTTTSYAHYYREAVFATEYLDHELAVVEQAYATAWAKANQTHCSSTTRNTPSDVTSCTVSNIVKAEAFSGCSVTAHGGGCYTQWYSVGQTVTPQNHIWVTKNALEPLSSTDGCWEGAVLVGGLAAAGSVGLGAVPGAAGGCVAGVGVDYAVNKFTDWLTSR